jgi:hypothetical protein
MTKPTNSTQQKTEAEIRYAETIARLEREDAEILANPPKFDWRAEYTDIGVSLAGGFGVIAALNLPDHLLGVALGAAGVVAWVTGYRWRKAHCSPEQRRYRNAVKNREARKRMEAERREAERAYEREAKRRAKYPWFYAAGETIGKLYEKVLNVLAYIVILLTIAVLYAVCGVIIYFAAPNLGPVITSLGGPVPILLFLIFFTLLRILGKLGG